MSQEFQAPRGTLDWYGARAALRRAVLDIAREVFESAGYGQIVTPTFEDTGVFARTSGEGSDVVRKEMYSFTDRSGRPLTLRPEGTAGVMRAYLEHMTRLPQPVKVWYEAPMFRYNAVQKGRYREHYQFGVEAIGSDDPAIDAEQIGLQRRWYRRVGVDGLQLLVNSIGDGKCRPAYLQLLVTYLDEHAAELCDECRERRDVNPLRTFDCKEKGCQAVMAGAPKITDHLCDECAAHFADVRAHLDARGVEYIVDPGLVRGLDYYTRTAWEWQWTALGAQSAISGGGRYDGLAEQLGGRPVPGVGFGAGIERLVLTLEETGAGPAIGRPVDVLFAVLADEARPRVHALMDEVREAGIACDAAFGGRRLKRALELADRRGVSAVVIVGDDEWAAGEASVRDMTTGDQRRVALERLAEELRR
ncbi:MAG TPA: histidine--tRNA ligase [Gaiellales bacterium]|jgi:histidyl-tRNA synthetase|nr:histidine--tRNA ligase [Gaiellales bacterium]